MGFLIVTCVLTYYGKCKMQLLNDGFNMLKVNSSTHVSCWKKLIPSTYIYIYIKKLLNFKERCIKLTQNC